VSGSEGSKIETKSVIGEVHPGTCWGNWDGKAAECKRCTIAERCSESTRKIQNTTPPVTKQKPALAPAKPRRMQGNPQCCKADPHSGEHDETDACDAEKLDCQPADPPAPPAPPKPEAEKPEPAKPVAAVEEPKVNPAPEKVAAVSNERVIEIIKEQLGKNIRVETKDYPSLVLYVFYGDSPDWIFQMGSAKGSQAVKLQSRKDSKANCLLDAGFKETDVVEAIKAIC
jgi:hypothetical protein